MFRRIALTAAFIASAAGAQPNDSLRNLRLTPFPNRVEARETLEVLLPGPRPSDEIPARLGREIDRVYAAFREVFPAVMSNKSRPEVFVIPGRTVADEFTRTVQDIPGTSYHGLLGVPAAVLEGSSESVLSGTLAHQMAHVFFNHDDRYRALDVWKVGSPIDTQLRATLYKFLDSARLIGVGDSLFEGLPIAGGQLQVSFDAVFSLMVDSRIACSKDLKTTRLEIEAFLRERLSPYTGTFVFTSTLEEIAFRDRLQAFRVDLFSCRHLVRPEEKALARLIEIGRSLHETMRNDYKQGLDTVRWRSVEDEADEAAVMVLNHLSLPPTDFSRQVLLENEAPGSNAVQRCDEDIRYRREVPFGDLADPQHSPCFRLQQVTRMANRLLVP